MAIQDFFTNFDLYNVDELPGQGQGALMPEAPIPEEDNYQNFSGIGTSIHPDVNQFQMPAPVEAPAAPVAQIQAAPVKSQAMPPMAKSAPTQQLPAPPESAGFTNNTVENLRAAQDQAAAGRLVNEIGRGTELIGTAISGAKPIAQEIFTQQAKDSDKTVERFEERAEKEKSDPKSAISNQFRDFVRQFGVDVPANMSAEAAAKVMPYAYQKFAAKQAQEARAFEAKENREMRKVLAESSARARKDAAEEKATEKQGTENLKFQERAAGKLISHGDNLNKLRRAKSMIDAAVKNPSGIKDVSALYGIITAFDPGSVVREGEIALADKAKGLFGSLDTKLSQISANPRLLNERILKDMQKTITELDNLAKNEYKMKRDVFINQAKQRGIPEEQFKNIDPYYALVQESQGPTPASVEGKQVVRKGYNSKTNQTQFIYSDGSKEIVEGKK